MLKGDWGKPFKKNYTWSQMTEEVMLNLMLESISTGIGKGTDGKIRAETYADVVEKFNEKMGTSITKQNIDSRMKTWRKQYKGITTLREQKGFRWDDKFHRIVAEYEVWREFIKRNDWAAPFREKCFLLYDKLALLFGNSSDTDAAETHLEDDAEAFQTQTDSNLNAIDAISQQDHSAEEPVDTCKNETELPAIPSRRRRRLSPLPPPPQLRLSQQRLRLQPDHPEFMSNYVREATSSIMRYLDEVKEMVIRKLEVVQQIEDRRLQRLAELEEQRVQLNAELEAMKTHRMAELESVQTQRMGDFGEQRSLKLGEREDKQIQKVIQKMNDDNCEEAYKYLMETQDLDDETVYASLQLLENKEKRKQFILLPHEKRIGWLIWTISNQKTNGTL